jgi:hypothetical protein
MGALDRGKPLAGGGGHDVNDAVGAVPLLEGDIEVYFPLPILPVSGENLKFRFGRRRRMCVVPFKKASP